MRKNLEIHGKYTSDKLPQHLMLTGLAAGLINGLLGTGGGILVVLMLGFFYPKLPPKDRFACALTVMLPTSALSMLFWAGELAVMPRLFRWLLPAAAGGLLGGFLLDRLQTRWLAKLFALLTIYAGAVMLMRA